MPQHTAKRLRPHKDVIKEILDASSAPLALGVVSATLLLHVPEKRLDAALKDLELLAHLAKGAEYRRMRCAK